MTKRLKRRIHELCGLVGLSREEKASKASTILADSDAKQRLCHQLVGATHRDVERALKELLTPRLTKEQELHAELEREQPEKLEPDLAIKRTRRKVKVSHLIDKGEVAKLISATGEPIKSQESKREQYYDCYSPGDVAELVSKQDGFSRGRQDQGEES